MIKITQKGDFRQTRNFLRKITSGDLYKNLDQLAREGVAALSAATPMDSGKTADSWDYTIERTKNKTSIYWTNSNFNDGVSIAVILQYGHATKNGGFVLGRDYINPALRPIFDRIANDAWKELTK